MDQGTALKIMNCSYNVFLTGAAGSGKTYLLNKFIDGARARGLRVGVTASTGIAATHLSGMTVHSFTGIGIRNELTSEDLKDITSKSRLRARFNKLDVLIVDEVSMLSADLVHMISNVCKAFRDNDKPFGGIQIIFCGDFFQLPPIGRRGEVAMAWECEDWNESDIKTCYLDKQFRHTDHDLNHLLNDIRSNDISEHTRELLEGRYKTPIEAGIKPTRIYTHNRDIDRINLEELSQIDGEEHEYEMEYSGPQGLVDALVRGCLAQQLLRLKKQSVVMFVKNSQEGGYINGTLGEVVDFSEEGNPIVKTTGGRSIEAKPDSWMIEENGNVLAEITQIPLRLAWAITVHKSQGMTLDAAEVDLSKSFEPGMGYVALSRVRSLQNLKLLGFNETSLKVNPKVLSKDMEFRNQSKLNEGLKIKKLKTTKSSEDKGFRVSEIRMQHPNAYKPWTEDEDQQLIKYFEDDMRPTLIAEKLGRQKGAIYARIGKLGLNS